MRGPVRNVCGQSGNGRTLTEQSPNDVTTNSLYSLYTKQTNTQTHSHSLTHPYAQTYTLQSGPGNNSVGAPGLGVC